MFQVERVDPSPLLLWHSECPSITPCTLRPHHEPPETPQNPAQDLVTLRQKEVERTAANILLFLQEEQDDDSLDHVVFSLEQSMAETHAKNPIDFSDMLTTNARILNAAFEFYLNKAHQSKTSNEKILLAMRAQSQLARTIDTWRRLANFQNGGTK